MFTKAKNNRFTNTSFTINTSNFNAGPGQALGRLYDSIAPNAIQNAGGRADEVRCHPGTREEVIGIIDKWRLDIQSNLIANQIFWLSGPAGAGKTAIVQTVAETWKSRGIHTANFFFFRADPSRSHAKSFVSTLLYQIFDLFPAARDAVERVLSLKPRILDAGLEERVDELICNVFRSVQPSSPHKIVLLIDGLDECNSEVKSSQTQILRILDKLVSQRDLPFLILVASRAEPHILTAFGGLTSRALSVFLDDQYSPEQDIRIFVTAEFEKIKASHVHAASLQSDWPSTPDIDAIVKKSSGQFIYPATVMRFLAQSSAVPSLSLERVHGIVPFAKNSAFTHLDAIYIYILEQVDDKQAVHDILSSALLDEHTTVHTAVGCPPPLQTVVIDGKTEHVEMDVPPGWGYRSMLHPRLPVINEFLRLYDARYTESLITSCMSDLSAIVQLQEGRMVFYHASLSDFLLDRSRSRLFHVDIEEFSQKVLPAVWNYPVIEEGGTLMPLGLYLVALIQHTTPAITKTLLTVEPLDSHTFTSYFQHGDFLEHISRLYYPNELHSYRQILKRWITWAVSTCDTAEDLQMLDNIFREPITEEWGRRLGLKQNHDRKTVIPLLRQHLFAARMKKRIGKAAKVFRF